MGARVASLWRPEPWGAGSGSRKGRHLGGGLRQVLERVDAPPVGAAAVAEELPLGGQRGEGRRFVVAAVWQPAQELRRDDVHAGVQPVGQERLLLEGGYAGAAVQAGDAEGAAETGEHDGGGGLLAAGVGDKRGQRLVGQDVAVQGDDGVFVRRKALRPQLEGAAAAQRLLLKGVLHPSPKRE